MRQDLPAQVAPVDHQRPGLPDPAAALECRLGDHLEQGLSRIARHILSAPDGGKRPARSGFGGTRIRQDVEGRVASDCKRCLPLYVNAGSGRMGRLDIEERVAGETAGTCVPAKQWPSVIRGGIVQSRHMAQLGTELKATEAAIPGMLVDLAASPNMPRKPPRTGFGTCIG